MTLGVEELERTFSSRKLVLVNPDILFLIFALRYGRASSEAIQHLQAYTTVVFDEFHLYSGVELAHALFMIHLALQMRTFKRIVLLSATPSVELEPYLKALNCPYSRPVSA
jgi:CRISPR-associated endonuclease/helicase Cas3